MVTCRDIITRALQQAGIVPLGRTPASKEAEAGLFALQGLYEGWISAGMFGRLKDVYETENYTAGVGERIFADGATITLPDTIEVDGVDTTPHDLGAVSINDGTWRHWLWDGLWTEITGLTLDTNAPLASRDREGLSSCLGSYLAEGFGGSIGPQTAKRAARFESSLSLKLGSTQDDTPSVYY